MNYLKTLSLVLVVAAAFTAYVAAGTASATTLEIEGAEQTSAVAFTMSLSKGGRTVFKNTKGEFFSLCSESELAGGTVPDESGDFTGPTVDATLSSFSIANCLSELNPATVLSAGQLSIAYTENTRGTVKSSGAEITLFWKLFKLDIVCKTAPAGTDIGTLTGVAVGNAILHVNAVLACSPFVIDMKWEGEYEVTSPNGLGVIP